MPRKEADPEELRQLTELFRQHGAEDPEQWAPSQLEEGNSRPRDQSEEGLATGVSRQTLTELVRVFQ